MFQKILLTIIILTTSLSYPQSRDDNKATDLCITYFSEHNYPLALKWCAQSSEQGDNLSLVILGTMYKNALGVQQDYIKAMRMYKFAALNNNAIAQHQIGDMYFNGFGVQKNYSEAAKWYERSLDNGNLGAATALADTYVMLQDFDTAIQLYSYLTEQGDLIAPIHLGNMYYTGEGVQQDFAKAHQLFKISAEKGEAMAQNNIGLLYLRGEGVPQNNQLALRWFQLAADQNYALAQYNLGHLYSILLDRGNAIKWFNTACLNYYEKACKQL